MGDWLHEEFVQSGKLPLTLCFVAFIVTFAITHIEILSQEVVVSAHGGGDA